METLSFVEEESEVYNKTLKGERREKPKAAPLSGGWLDGCPKLGIICLTRMARLHTYLKTHYAIGW